MKSPKNVINIFILYRFLGFERYLQLPPPYLIQLIRKWFVMEYIHLFMQQSGRNILNKDIDAFNHWKINVDCLFLWVFTSILGGFKSS